MKLPTISKESQKGFTLVELIIVIVVIGILAAIILVAYGNVTTRANASAAKSNASAVQNFAEVYHADGGTYPVAIDGSNPFPTTTDSATFPKGITVQATNPTSSDAKGEKIGYKPTSTGKGFCVAYWNANKTGGAQVSMLSGGDATVVLKTDGTADTCS